ncbi:hypothetical protein PIB30_101856 [Stylosanthes scabra]|uniref:CCHC-type domain-containing protein n=1 Tax=Stylosanthes scabra TaxID=79078 RepID=A0ABU6XVF4_9FABA|nr:hypothetical protein [Stylosanthes scabra]
MRTARDHRVWTDFKIERIIDCYCYNCGRLGHAKKDCTFPLALSIKDNKSPRYGPGLGVNRAKEKVEYRNKAKKGESCNNLEEGEQLEDNSMDQARDRDEEEKASKEDAREVRMEVEVEAEDNNVDVEEDRMQELEFAINKARARWARIKEKNAEFSATQNENAFSVEQEKKEFDKMLRKRSGGVVKRLGKF